MEEAVHLVGQGYSIYKAAKLTGVPRTTLNDRFTGRVQDPTKWGGQPIFSREMEEKLVKHVTTMARFGYGYTRSQLIFLATDMSEFGKKRKCSKQLSRNWLDGFLGRWPELRVTKPRKLCITRAESTTPAVIEAYFEELRNIMTKYDLLSRPESVYNIDETGFSPEHHPPKVINMMNIICVLKRTLF